MDELTGIQVVSELITTSGDLGTLFIIYLLYKINIRLLIVERDFLSLLKRLQIPNGGI